MPLVATARALVLVLAVATPPVSASAAADSTWVDHQVAARAAYANGNWAGLRWHSMRAGSITGDTPRVNYNLALAAVQLGDRQDALVHLGRFADSGLTIQDVATDSDFVALWGDAEFRRIAARIRANSDSIGVAREYHRFQDASWLTEDLAFDPATRSWFVTSVHRGQVLEIGANGAEHVLLDPGARPGWGRFGACVDPERRVLWTSEAALPTCEGYTAADSGRTGLVAWDLRTRTPLRRIEWPRDGRLHLLGDLTVGADGTVYVTDSRTGAVRIVAPGAGAMTTLVPDGTFGSPQTPALAADGRHLYVPDYSRGIASVALATGKVSWLTFAPGIALQGIDGLCRNGRDLIAVQNGTQPHRVMRFQLDETGSRIVSGTPIESGTHRLGEPTHAAIAGDEVYFLANTGWDRVGRDETMRPDEAPPASILVVTLRTAR